MSHGQRRTLHLATLAVGALAATVAAVLVWVASGHARATTASTGGAPIGGLAPSRPPRRKLPPAPSKKAKGHWLKDVNITEYWPAPESWFKGKLVKAPGLPGEHRIDWLYSANGLSMEGEGIGLDGHMYHIEDLGNGGWVTATGASTSPSDGWGAGAPFWRAGGYWHNRQGGVTFPLATGGWYAGAGRKYVPLPGVTFAAGASLPLRYYQSIAVDPSVIPLGSRLYVPAYNHDGHGGWFVAQDTGGAINGNHIDVFRSPPASPTASGLNLIRQRIYVIKPAR
jgi:3D (Asp-Asp-Asp) domain-containing protein